MPRHLPLFYVCWQNSLTRRAPLVSEAQGRSGARFHTSYDKRYVVKTISSEDVAEMHNILKKYHQVRTQKLIHSLYKRYVHLIDVLPIILKFTCTFIMSQMVISTFLAAVYRGISWYHTAATVLRHVPPHCRWRRDLYDSHTQRIQPSVVCV